jgi:hypothetical protein
VNLGAAITSNTSFDPFISLPMKRGTPQRESTKRRDGAQRIKHMGSSLATRSKGSEICLDPRIDQSPLTNHRNQGRHHLPSAVVGRQCGL